MTNNIIEEIMREFDKLKIEGDNCNLVRAELQSECWKRNEELKIFNSGIDKCKELFKTSLNEVAETREKEILDNAEELVSEAHKLGLNGEQTQVRIQTRNLIKKILKK